MYEVADKLNVLHGKSKNYISFIVLFRNRGRKEIREVERDKERDKERERRSHGCVAVSELKLRWTYYFFQ